MDLIRLKNLPELHAIIVHYTCQKSDATYNPGIPARKNSKRTQDVNPRAGTT